MREENDKECMNEDKFHLNLASHARIRETCRRVLEDAAQHDRTTLIELPSINKEMREIKRYK